MTRRKRIAGDTDTDNPLSTNRQYHDGLYKPQIQMARIDPGDDRLKWTGRRLPPKPSPRMPLTKKLMPGIPLPTRRRQYLPFTYELIATCEYRPAIHGKWADLPA